MPIIRLIHNIQRHQVELPGPYVLRSVSSYSSHYIGSSHYLLLSNFSYLTFHDYRAK